MISKFTLIKSINNRLNSIQSRFVLIVPILLSGWLLATTNPAMSKDIFIDSDYGKINGSANSYNGVPFTVKKIYGGIGIVTQFSFAGDLVIEPGTRVWASGYLGYSNGVSLYSANNVVIGAGTHFDFSAQDIYSWPGPGGGWAVRHFTTIMLH